MKSEAFVLPTDQYSWMYIYDDCWVFRDQVATDLLVVGDVNVAVGGASYGLPAALATRHVLHIQHQLGTHLQQVE